MFRGGTIELSSPVEMVRNIMAGTWVEYERNGWHVFSCPLFTVMEKACQEGTDMLPLSPWRQTYAELVWSGGSSKQLLKPGETRIVISGQASFVRVVLYGQGDR
jgi:hypothetical protein